MCNYCSKGNGNENIFQDKASSIGIKKKLFFNTEVYGLCVRLLGSQTSIVVNINYCPKCGRKLGE